MFIILLSKQSIQLKWGKMEELESSVIEHLIEVETQASTVTLNAQQEALKIINNAKAKAETEYLQKYNEQLSKIVKEWDEKAKEISDSSEQEISKYKECINSTSQNTEAFNKLMDSIIASGLEL